MDFDQTWYILSP